MAERKKSKNKKQKYVTINGIKVGIQNLCILISTLLMTISILVFSIIYISRNDSGEQKATKPNKGNSIISTTTEKSTHETITIETGEEVEETTEEVETLEFDADDDGSSTGESPLSVKFSAASHWNGEYGNVVIQYKLVLTNTSNKTIKNWGLSVHYDKSFKLMDRWNGVMEKDENNIKITPTNLNQTIKPGEEFIIGFIVETDGYVYPESFTIVLDEFSKTIYLSFRRPVQTTPVETTTEDESTSEDETTTDENETTTIDGETTEPSGEDSTTTGENETSTEESETTTINSDNNQNEEPTTTLSSEG